MLRQNRPTLEKTSNSTCSRFKFKNGVNFKWVTIKINIKTFL